MKRVLFLCTHNSCRSQIAEGILRQLHGDKFEVFSAGIKPSEVSPYAIKCMAEVGIDISKHKSKPVERFLGERFDYVITVCDSAKESCPFFSGGAKHLQWNFIDPASATGSEEEIMSVFREARDEIKNRIKETFREID
ncbi:MAG: arsenate reductase ArsC [Candidatus Hydrothermarchaeota archaeon]